MRLAQETLSGKGPTSAPLGKRWHCPEPRQGVTVGQANAGEALIMIWLETLGFGLGEPRKRRQWVAARQQDLKRENNCGVVDDEKALKHYERQC